MSKNHKEVLQKFYDSVFEGLQDPSIVSALPSSINDWLKEIISKAENNKAVLTVLITLITHKIIDPVQDVRKHQAQIEGGFAGRTIDTLYITPFMQEKQFPAMAQSGWLTRSLEQSSPYNLDYKGNIRPESVKKAFLGIIDSIQNERCDAEAVLKEILRLLIEQRDAKNITLAKPHNLSISRIIKLLQAHFTYKYKCQGASRLPVLAIYAAYQCMMDQVARFRNLVLEPLESHNSADRRSGRIGDIDVSDASGFPVEGVEVKHGIVITPQLINEAYEKFKAYRTARYYLLSTANLDSADVDAIEEVVDRIEHVHGCQVIVNGVYSTLRYYLRLLADPADFVSKYVDLLAKDPAAKFQHKAAWNDLVDKNCHS